MALLTMILSSQTAHLYKNGSNLDCTESSFTLKTGRNHFAITLKKQENHDLKILFLNGHDSSLVLLMVVSIHRQV